MAAEPAGRVAILTPGPLNETYYEHAYIARYLGIMLLEGEDLTVSDGRLMVRTVSGLKPVSVLWRRLDAAFADPLELQPAFADRHARPGRGAAPRLGLAGQRARLRHPGDARASSPSCRSFARALRGEELLLPSIATWWCGQAAEREHVHRQSRPHDDRPGAVDAACPSRTSGATVLGAALDAGGAGGADRAARRETAPTSSARKR